MDAEILTELFLRPYNVLSHKETNYKKVLFGLAGCLDGK